MNAPSGGSKTRQRKPTSASRKAIAKPIPTAITRELDVLDERRLEDVAPVLAHPLGAEPAVVARHSLPWPKFGITGPAGQAEARHPGEQVLTSHAGRAATPTATERVAAQELKRAMLNNM